MFKSVNYILVTAVLFEAAVFTCFETSAQKNIESMRPKSYFGVGIISSWHPVRTPAYSPGRLNLTLHSNPSPELYFLAGFPIGKKGFGLELTASAGLLFFRESFTVDSVFVNDQWTDDRFRRMRMGETFYGRFALQGFWRKKLPSAPITFGFSAGVGTTLYMPTTLSSLGVDYSFSPNPVNVSIQHQVRINTPNGNPHLFIPVVFSIRYSLPGSHVLTFLLRGGFSHHDLISSRYVYQREGYYESQSAITRDISFGFGIGYSYPFKPRKKR